MNLIQFRRAAGERAVGRVIGPRTVRALEGVASIYDLALRAIEEGRRLGDLAEELTAGPDLDYDAIAEANDLLSPIDHSDPAHMLVTGTGLTHLGSADTRAAMHARTVKSRQELTDSMKMFRMGLEGGKPSRGLLGVQPEWFYKGDGSIVVPPGGILHSPSFALDGGEEPEIAGIYVIGPKGTPYRVGFALGNEFSDHKMERINYLYLAHSKLRPCAIGPELLAGPLPGDIRGMSRILRDGKVLWEKPFLSGEDNMSHSVANLEAHHFKYAAFLRPGDVHIHFFGTATLSFSDRIEPRAGDVFEIACDVFGRPLRNPLGQAEETERTVMDLA